MIVTVYLTNKRLDLRQIKVVMVTMMRIKTSNDTLHTGGTRYMLIGVTKVLSKGIIIKVRISIADHSRTFKLCDPAIKRLIFRFIDQIQGWTHSGANAWKTSVMLKNLVLHNCGTNSYSCIQKSLPLPNQLLITCVVFLDPINIHVGYVAILVSYTKTSNFA